MQTLSSAPAPVTPQVKSVTAADGASAELLLIEPDGPAHCQLYWLPAMGVPARHYLPFATALAGHGVAVALHEWRGIGSSDRRAGRGCDWGYRQLVGDDLPAGLHAARQHWPELPRLLGGHSLGGQLAALYAGRDPTACAGLVLMASGLPYWRCFAPGWLIGLAYVAAPALADIVGYLPGRRIGFGGNEARGVIRDWARSGRHGNYRVDGLPIDLEPGLARLAAPVLAIRAADDWLAPAASLQGLLAKLPRSQASVAVLDAEALGTRADHFAWMWEPCAVAGCIGEWLRQADALFRPNGEGAP